MRNGSIYTNAQRFLDFNHTKFTTPPSSDYACLECLLLCLCEAERHIKNLGDNVLVSLCLIVRVIIFDHLELFLSGALHFCCWIGVLLASICLLEFGFLLLTEVHELFIRFVLRTAPLQSTLLLGIPDEL